MHKIDSLIEISATFFKKGNEAASIDLDDFEMWSVEDIATITELNFEKLIDSEKLVKKPMEFKVEKERDIVTIHNNIDLTFRSEETDTVFLEDAIGFKFNNFSEGALDSNYMSCVEFLQNDDSWEGILCEDRASLIKDANIAFNQLKNKDNATGVRWIGVLSSWTRGTRDYFDDSYDYGVVYSGRITLEQISSLL